MCCTRLAENTGRKKVAKNRHLGTIAQLCQGASVKLCGVEQTAPPMFGRATITLGTGPHSSYNLLSTDNIAASCHARISSSGNIRWCSKPKYVQHTNQP